MTDPYSILRAGSEPPPPPQLQPLGSQPLVALMGTGLYTAIQIGICVYALLILNGLAFYGDFALMLPFLGLFVGGIAGYVTLCLWMQAVQSRLVAARYPAPASWKIWASWFIPLYAFVGPLLVMQQLRPRTIPGSTFYLAMWWLGFIGFVILDRVFTASTQVTSSLDGLLIASIILIAGSYLALAKLITDISASLNKRW